MKKFFVRVFMSLGLLTVATTFALSQMNEKDLADLYAQVEIFSYALTTIQSEYVDQKTPQELIYGALRGMLSSLDPHSQFLDPEEYKELKTETQGKFGGLGIEISIRDGLLTVITPIEGTPAWEAGLRAGDRIVKIEDEVTKDMTLSDAVKRLRGEPGSEVHITVLREKEFKLHEFTIKREIIQIQDVKDPQILDDHIAYVRLTEFREDSAKDFHKALTDLAAQGADSLILDLRNNPGGLLNVAIDITDEFLPPGKVIVSTKGRRPTQTSVANSTDREKTFLNLPMVILINEGSASGSEILAGALKDNHRAVIVGKTSFGKGSVQSVIPLPDGSGLRLTTAKYFTPSGVSIHGKGITPDVEVEYVYPDEEEENDKEKNPSQKVDEVFKKIDNQLPEDPRLAEEKKRAQERHDRLLKDTQVQAAINVIKGIRVYRAFEATEEKAASPSSATLNQPAPAEPTLDNALPDDTPSEE